jgi:hypothetical protein
MAAFSGMRMGCPFSEIRKAGQPFDAGLSNLGEGPFQNITTTQTRSQALKNVNFRSFHGDES